MLCQLMFGLVWRMTTRVQGVVPGAIDARRAAIEFFIGNISRLNARLTRLCPTVLAHGDLHIGNVLMATASKEVVLIDWQASGVRPLFYDLCYFMGTSVPIEIRRQHMERWIEIYLKELQLVNIPPEVVRECFELCTVALLVPILFMPFLIKSDLTNGMMHYESTGIRAQAMIDDCNTVDRIRRLVEIDPMAKKAFIWQQDVFAPDLTLLSKSMIDTSHSGCDLPDAIADHVQERLDEEQTAMGE